MTKWLTFYLTLIVLYVWGSYFFVDRNLLFTTWQPYVNWQTGMWDFFCQYQDSVVWGYGVLVLALTSVYVKIVSDARKGGKLLSAGFLDLFTEFTTDRNRQLLIVAICAVPLIFAYNALSHDVFNYIFNAKMVIEYQADPHVQVALDFPDDVWLRFMHNVHTAAPYWYGWTAWSLLPYLIGMGKFTLTWILFKVFSFVSLLGLVLGVRYLYQQVNNSSLPDWLCFAVFLNPLVLIEIVGTAHNDGWMMIPALFGTAFIWKSISARAETQTTIKYAPLLLGVVLILISASTKYVTGVLLVVVAGWIAATSPLFRNLGNRVLSKLKVGWTELFFLGCSVALFVPLLTPRAQQFHPWYLLWSLLWLPVVESRWWRALLIGLSVSSLLRYMPWLFEGGYTTAVHQNQLLITWVGGLVVAVIGYMVWMTMYKSRRSR